MKMDDVTASMRERYANVYPLIFSRSVERAKDLGELFDILEELPKDLPVIWNHEKRRWVVTDDLTQTKKFKPSHETT